MEIGFIGQGFVGKAYADDFAKRGYDVVRYSVDKEFSTNKERIADCAIVFIAVPTPTTMNGFDDHIVNDVLSLVGDDAIAVIKSTILPGTTKKMQEAHPCVIVLHSPEFLTEKTAAYDAAHPDRNIMGIPSDTKKYRSAARKVLDVLPRAPFELICRSEEAELIKYGGNCWFYVKVVYVNMLYDLARAHGLNWDVIEKGMAADPRIGPTHLRPEHSGGRGAGGHCFIKDFAALVSLYEQAMPKDADGRALLDAMARKNNQLLKDSHKDIDLLRSVYGE